MDRPRASSAAKIAVLISGTGSNLQALIDAIGAGELDAELAVVLSNRDTAFGLERAAAAGIPTEVLAALAGEQRDVYDARLADLVASYEPDLIVLAGWLRILSSTFIDRYPNRIINLHPALPGELAGLHAIERAYDEFQAGERTHTGVMVHLVPDEGVDTGPTLASETVAIEPDDSLDALATRMHATEHRLLVSTLQSFIHEQLPTLEHS